MNHADPFEQRLRRQPLRAVPPAWREEILGAAAASRPVAPPRELAPLGALRLRLRELFWPAPQAWAGLAAIWLVVLSVNLAMREPAPRGYADRVVPATPLMRELVKEQRQWFAELVGPTEKREADRPKPLAPQPRSLRREEFLNA